MSASRSPDVRARIAAVRRRFETDPAFRERATADLAGTLREAEPPEEALERFEVRAEEEAEVGGYFLPDGEWDCACSGGLCLCIGEGRILN